MLTKPYSKTERYLRLASVAHLAHEQNLQKLNYLRLSETDSLSPIYSRGTFGLSEHGSLRRYRNAKSL